MTFRKARLQDVDAIISLVQSRIDWMNDVGLHQWNETDYFGRYPRSYWERNIDYFLVGEEEGRVVVAIALYTEDVRWTHDGEYTGTATGQAYYLHHLVTNPACKGAGKKMMLYVDSVLEMNGVGIVGHAFFQTFKYNIVPFDTVGIAGVDQEAVVEGFV